MTTIAQIDPTRVTVGVDTHRDIHVAVALDQLGRRLGEFEIPTSAAGYELLIEWAQGFGDLEAFGVEGTGCYGAGLARHLRAQSLLVFEVIRPNRQTRRRKGKSDPADAEAAARAVLSGEAAAIPKAGDDVVEMIRVLRVARSTALKARTQAMNAMRALVVTAPGELRDRFRDMPGGRLVEAAARLRPGSERTTLSATKVALRQLAGRHLALTAEVEALDARLDALTAVAAPGGNPTGHCDT